MHRHGHCTLTCRVADSAAQGGNRSAGYHGYHNDTIIADTACLEGIASTVCCCGRWPVHWVYGPLVLSKQAALLVWSLVNICFCVQKMHSAPSNKLGGLCGLCACDHVGCMSRCGADRCREVWTLQHLLERHKCGLPSTDRWPFGEVVIARLGLPSFG